MKTLPSQGTDTCNAEPTPQSDNLLMQGWQAARQGQPLDTTQAWHWQQGWRLWHHAHPAQRSWALH